MIPQGGSFFTGSTRWYQMDNGFPSQSLLCFCASKIAHISIKSKGRNWLHFLMVVVYGGGGSSGGVAAVPTASAAPVAEAMKEEKVEERGI